MVPTSSDQRRSLARTGQTDNEAAAVRLRAARIACGLTQKQLADAAGVGATQIINMEKARSFPSRAVIVYLSLEHRLDANFLILGQYAQLPSDVQEPLFLALTELSGESADSREA